MTGCTLGAIGNYRYYIMNKLASRASWRGGVRSMIYGKVGASIRNAAGIQPTLKTNNIH